MKKLVFILVILGSILFAQDAQPTLIRWLTAIQNGQAQKANSMDVLHKSMFNITRWQILSGISFKRDEKYQGENTDSLKSWFNQAILAEDTAMMGYEQLDSIRCVPLLKPYGLNYKDISDSLLAMTDVPPHSNAEKFGLKINDIILSYAGYPVYFYDSFEEIKNRILDLYKVPDDASTWAWLHSIIKKKTPPKTVPLKVSRHGEKIILQYPLKDDYLFGVQSIKKLTSKTDWLDIRQDAELRAESLYNKIDVLGGRYSETNQRYGNIDDQKLPTYLRGSIDLDIAFNVQNNIEFILSSLGYPPPADIGSQQLKTSLESIESGILMLYGQSFMVRIWSKFKKLEGILYKGDYEIWLAKCDLKTQSGIKQGGWLILTVFSK